MLVDTHCHLTHNLLADQLEAVLERAHQRGVQRILVPGIDLAASETAEALSRRYEMLYAAVGIHPNDALSWTPQTRGRLQALAASPKVVAIGEIGLDYYRQHAPHSLQQEILDIQLELATQVQKPVIIHNRQATADLLPRLFQWQENLLKSGSALAQRPGVFHSFEGSLEIALAIIEHRFLIGVCGPITYKNAAERQQVIAALPLESLVLETDAPYLPPHPHRGQTNEPAYIELINDRLSELHRQKPVTTMSITSHNAARLFGWSAPLQVVLQPHAGEYEKTLL